MTAANQKRMEVENHKRVELGLRVIRPPDWYLYSVEFDEENWKKTSAGDYEAKKLHRDPDGRLVWEEDYYYSGRSYIEPNNGVRVWEMLTINYDYTSSSLAVEYGDDDPTIQSLIDKLSAGSTMKEKLSIADQILTKWGLSRL